MNTTLVCFAVKEEAKFFDPIARARPELRVLITGMGKRNAKQAIASALKRERPILVISAGFAGGLRPGLPGGTVLFALEGQPALRAALMDAGAQPARFHCAEKVAAIAAEKKILWERTGADAVEMESEVICASCHQQGIPGATVRVVLDPAEEDLPLDFNRLMTSDQRLDPRKLAIKLARSPQKIPALLRLRRQSNEAAQKLADVLSQVICAQ